MTTSALYSAGSEHWNTPRWLVALVQDLATNEAGHQKILLDPCWNERAVTNPIHKIQLPEDGLARSWDDYPTRGVVFVNPPYGVGTIKWVIKAEETVNTVVMLLPARTDTKAGQRVLEGASAVCFLRGRVRFGIGGEESPTGAPFPSMVALWTRDRAVLDDFLATFDDHGVVMKRDYRGGGQ